MWWLQGVLKVSVLVGAIVRAVQRLINSRLSSLNRYLCWLLRVPLRFAVVAVWQAQRDFDHRILHHDPVVVRGLIFVPDPGAQARSGLLSEEQVDSGAVWDCLR